MKLAFKKFAVLGLLGLAIFTLVGCDWFGTTTTTTTATTVTTATTATTTTTTTTPTTTSTTTTTPTTTTTTLSDAQKVQAVFDALDLGDVTAVTEDLVLPEPTTYGVNVSWSSSDEDWVTDNGEITTPTYVGGARTVTMTATITLGAVTMTKDFSVRVASETVTQFLTRAGNAIIITGADNILTNFTLTDTSLGCDVTWTSADPSMVGISATATAGLYTATVVRPKMENGGVNTTVVLTATISYDEGSLDVTKNVRIIAEPLATVYTSFETLHNSASLNDYVDLTGVVYSKFYLGYFMVDEFGKYIAIYTNATYAGAVAIGDEVRIKGKYAVYNTLYQISGLTFQEVLTSDNPTGITPIVLEDPTALLDVDYSDKLIHGQVYTITVTPQIRGAYGNVYLFDGETQIATVYYNSLSTSIDLLESYVGQKITINVTYYTFYTGSSVLVPGVSEVYITFDGAAEDIVIPELTNEEKLAADVLGLATATAVFGGQPVTLPTAGGYASVISWAVTAGGANATISGTKVTYADVVTEQTITLTATLTLGALTPATKDFTVVITPITTSTIAQVKALDPADLPFVQMEGVIYFIYTRGYYIQDETGKIAIYVGAVPAATLHLGDKVIVIGTLASYKEQLQITTPVVKSEVSDSNPYAQTPTTYVPGTTTLVSGATYAITCDLFNGIVASVDAVNSNVYLLDGETVLGLIYYRSNTDSLNALKAATGKEATINVVYYYHSYGTAYFVYQEGTAGIVLTDAQIAKDEVAALAINQSPVSGDVDVLPTTAGTSTVTWALATTTFATLDGATLTCATVSTEQTVTLTATLSHPVSGGSPIVTTKEFIVTISTLEVKLNADITALTVAGQNEMSTLTLPTTGVNGSAITWTMDATANASLATNVVTLNFKGSAYTITLHAALSIGGFNGTKDFTVDVVAVTVITDIGSLSSQAADAWTVANANGLYIRGVVSQAFGTKFFMQDAAGNGLYLYQDGLGLTLGDEIIVSGNLVDYNTANPIAVRIRELTTIVVKANLSSGNAIVTTPMTAAEVAAMANPYAQIGRIIVATNLVVQGSDSGNFYLTWKIVGGTPDVTYKIGFYKDQAPWLLDAFVVGDLIPSIQFTPNSIATNGQTLYVTNVVLAMTDLQKATYDLTMIANTLTTSLDYVYPTAKYASAYSTVIKSGLASGLTIVAGGYTIAPQEVGDITGVVTVTATSGTTTVSKDVAVTITAIDAATRVAGQVAALTAEFEGKTFKHNTTLGLDTTGLYATTIVWASNNEPIVNSTTGAVGTVTDDVAVVLTATVTFGASTTPVTLNITISQKIDTLVYSTGFEDVTDLSGYTDTAFTSYAQTWTATNAYKAGTTGSDRGVGAVSIRLKTTSSTTAPITAQITSNFTVTGLSQIKVSFADYGTHTKGTLYVYISENGTDWVCVYMDPNDPTVGNYTLTNAVITINYAQAELVTAGITATDAVYVRFTNQIIAGTGTGDRSINIDEIYLINKQ